MRTVCLGLLLLALAAPASADDDDDDDDQHLSKLGRIGWDAANQASAKDDKDDSPAGQVYTLDAKSFHAMMHKVSYLCVLFVAPDCGECQTFAEEFHDAAKEVAAPGTPLRMAELMVKPGSDEEKIAHAYGITGQKFSPGYPTVYLFKRGEMSGFYNWGVNEKSLIKAGAIEDWVTDQVPWKPAPPDATEGWMKKMKEAEQKAKERLEKEKKGASIEMQDRRLSSDETTTFVV